MLRRFETLERKQKSSWETLGIVFSGRSEPQGMFPTLMSLALRSDLLAEEHARRGVQVRPGLRRIHELVLRVAHRVHLGLLRGLQLVLQALHLYCSDGRIRPVCYSRFRSNAIDDI